MKKILLLMIVITIGHTDTIVKMKKHYKPMYTYTYSYSKLINMNNYFLKYTEMKNEHKKVVRLLDNANKTINNLEYRIEMLEKNVKYWQNRNSLKTSVSDQIKRESALKKMKEQLKIK